MRAILRAGTYELIARADVPVGIGHFRICRRRPRLFRQARKRLRQRPARRDRQRGSRLAVAVTAPVPRLAAQMNESEVIERLRRIATDPAARGLADDVALFEGLVITSRQPCGRRAFLQHRSPGERRLEAGRREPLRPRRQRRGPCRGAAILSSVRTGLGSRRDRRDRSRVRKLRPPAHRRRHDLAAARGHSNLRPDCDRTRRGKQRRAGPAAAAAMRFGLRALSATRRPGSKHWSGAPRLPGRWSISIAGQSHCWRWDRRLPVTRRR